VILTSNSKRIGSLYWLNKEKEIFGGVITVAPYETKLFRLKLEQRLRPLI